MKLRKIVDLASVPERPAVKWGLCLAAWMAAGLLVCSPAHAQRYLGGLSGTVADQTGAMVPGAQVLAVEVSTQFKTTVTTGADGAFSIPSLSPGTYAVSVTAKGFKTDTRVNVVLTAGQVVQLDFKLSPGEVSQSITVAAETASLIDTTSPTVATTIDQQEVVDLPNEGRNPYVLATLTPGVVDTASGGYFEGHASQYTNPYSGVAVQITAFGNSGHNRLTLDGIPNDAPERFSGDTYTNFVPSPEAVQEVKVEDGMWDAQFGHGNGVVTNVVVKSGTNHLHGAAYYVFENTYLDANTYDHNAAQKPRSNNQVNQTGLVLDGPVVLPKLYNGRNKTFFMFSFERYATHTPQNFSTRVPTSGELGGDFSGLCPGGFNSSGFCTSSGGTQLFVPNSPLDANNNRTEYFMNNNLVASSFGTASYTCTSGTCTVSGFGAPVAGSSAINATGAALASYFPAANVAGSTAASSASQPNYVSTQTTYPATYPSFIGRFDFELGQNDKLSVIGFRSGLTQSYPMEGYTKGIGPSGYGYSVYRNNRGGSVDEVHQFSSTLVLDSRFGLIYHPFGLLYPGNSGFDLTKLSMTQAGLPYNTFPGETSSDSYSGLAPGAGGQISTSAIGSLDEILSKALGRHSFRFGFQGDIMRYDVQNPMSGFGNGSGTSGFAFDRRFTQSNSVTYGAGSAPATNGVGSGDPIASMLLGDFSTDNYNIAISYATQQIYMAPFFQDDWRVTNKLTLNLGARYDYESPLTERYNRMISGFCLTCVNPLQNSVPGLALNGGPEFVSPSSRFPYPHDTHDLAPRLGAEYLVRPNTVVRAGFGIIFFNTLESPYSTGFSQATSSNNWTSSAPLNSATNPFPTGVVLPTGNTLGLETGLGQGINFNDQTHVQPRSAEYTLNIQQQLPFNIALQAGYVGSRPTRLEVSKNINALPAMYYNQGASEVAYLTTKVANPMAGQFASTYASNATLNAATIEQYLLLVPFPEFGSVTEQNSSIGSAPYNSLQIQVSHPMTHHLAIQGNLTWDKLMLHNGYLNSGIDTHLESYEDNNSNVLANIFGTYELPTFTRSSYLERLALGGWKLNGVLRMANGNLISAPGNVNIIGPTGVANRSYSHFINTCYENASGVLVVGTGACSSSTDTPAYEQRLSYTTQTNAPYIGVREQFHPLMDASMFKTFPIREGMTFEIRGEFFNILNSPIFGGPNTSVGSTAFGVVSLTQANDPRFGQLTARLNF
ncbi:MAG: carboxypeptidase regulatory-like domain-containing protein [Terracidiphilus sp.]